jgi:hypothetical protein
MITVLYPRTRVTPIRYPRPLLRYMLLFQSWRQLQLWLVCGGLALLFIHGFMRLSSAHGIPLATALGGAALGALCSVALAVPAQFSVAPGGEKARLALVRELAQMGFILHTRTARRAVYRQDLPQLLRWDEGNISLEFQPDAMTVSGPLIAIRRLRQVLSA